MALAVVSTLFRSTGGECHVAVGAWHTFDPRRMDVRSSRVLWFGCQVPVAGADRISLMIYSP